MESLSLARPLLGFLPQARRLQETLPRKEPAKKEPLKEEPSRENPVREERLKKEPPRATPLWSKLRASRPIPWPRP